MNRKKRELLLIVILSIAKNLKTHLRSIRRCFVLLNMTFLGNYYKNLISCKIPT